jgi:uncharacterized protein involved in cysteine biosynthesis
VSKDDLRRRYDRPSQWPLVVLALLLVAAYAWGVLRPDLPGWLLLTSDVVTVLTWPVFLVEHRRLLGVVTAAVASWFVGRVTEAAQAQDDEDDAALLPQVRELAEEVRQLRAEPAGREAPVRPTGSG